VGLFGFGADRNLTTFIELLWHAAHCVPRSCYHGAIGAAGKLSITGRSMLALPRIFDLGVPHRRLLRQYSRAIKNGA
jgi:hypothetical protein